MRCCKRLTQGFSLLFGVVLFLSIVNFTSPKNIFKALHKLEFLLATYFLFDALAIKTEFGPDLQDFERKRDKMRGQISLTSAGYEHKATVALNITDTVLTSPEYQEINSCKLSQTTSQDGFHRWNL